MEIKCLIQKEGQLYIAMSLEFGLACQADTLSDARSKLEGQIQEYMDDAVAESSQEKQKYLMGRKGPWQWFAIYYFALAFSKVNLHILKVVDLLLIQNNNTIRHA